jgi:hypothetical protein
MSASGDNGWRPVAVHHNRAPDPNRCRFPTFPAIIFGTAARSVQPKKVMNNGGTRGAGRSPL